MTKESTVAKHLQAALVDTFALYVKTHSFHWNVEGPHFKSLHELFEEQYTDMWEALDDLAERQRALGAIAPVGAAALLDKNNIGDESDVPEAYEMLDKLIEGNKSLVKTLKKGIEVAEDNGDPATADMLTERVETHEQFIWMLSSSRKGMWPDNA